jgi:ribosomal protein S18 acetylase RimI-like enzyme
MFSARIERVRSVLVRHGPTGMIRMIRDRGRAREYVLYCRDLEDAALEDEPSDVRLGVLDELAFWRRTRESVSPPFVADRTGGWTDFCWAWRGGQPVGIVWTTTHSPLLLTAADEAVIVDLYTSPESRGLGIAPALIAAACRQLSRRSCRRAFATVEVQNTPSRRAFERSGFRSIGQFTLRGWLRRPQRTAAWLGRPLTGGSS